MITSSSSLLILSESSKGKYVITFFTKKEPLFTIKQVGLADKTSSDHRMYHHWRGRIKHNVNNKTPNWQQWDGSCEVVTSQNWVDTSPLSSSPRLDKARGLLSSFVFVCLLNVLAYQRNNHLLNCVFTLFFKTKYCYEKWAIPMSTTVRSRPRALK